MTTKNIYKLICPDTNCVVYIGATVKPLSKRLTDHISQSLVVDNSKKDKWLNSKTNCGKKPKIQLIEIVAIDIWEQREQFWISHYKSMGFDLLNSTVGGQGSKGLVMPESAKKILSEQRIGKKVPNKVFKSPFIRSKEAYEKRVASYKKTIAERGFKSRKTGEYLNREIIQTTVDGVFIAEFSTTAQASIITGINRSSITENVRGANKTARGFIFKYKNPKI